MRSVKTDHQKVLFIINTEYQFLITLSLIYNKYKDWQHFLLIKTNRLSENYDLSRFSVFNINFNQYNYSHNIDLTDQIEKVKKGRYQDVVFYQEHCPLNIYMVHYFKNKYARIILGPDGAKAYCDITKLAPRYKIKAYLSYRKFLHANRLETKAVKIPSLIYGGVKDIDLILIQYDEAFVNRSKKKIEKFSFLNTLKEINFITKIFDKNFSFYKSDCIFYISQNFVDEAQLIAEVEFLKDVLKIHPKKTLFVKIHPLASETQIKLIRELSSVEIIKKSLPAELYIAHINNGIILSMWSTASLYFKESNRYYWAFPMFKKKGIMIDWLNLYNPTDHIKLIDTAIEVI